MTNDSLDLSYAAGLFDGEGTVTLCRLHQGCYRAPRVSVPSCTAALLSWMWTRFGGCISMKRTYRKNHSPSSAWSLNGDAALQFLDLIFPYLHEPEKIRRARMLTEEYKGVTPRNGRYTPERLRSKRDFEKRFFKNTRRRLALTL